MVDTTLDPPREGNLRNYAAIAIVLLDGIGFGVVSPLLPFIVLNFGGTPTLVTQLVGLYALAGFAGSILSGDLCDRFGRVNLVRGTLAGSVVAYLGMAFATSLLGLFFFRGLAGLMTGRDSVVRTMATDGLPPEQHVQKIGTLAAINTIGSAVGPGLASIIGVITQQGADYYRMVFFVATGCTIFTAVLVFLAWRTADPPRRSAAQVKTQSKRLVALAPLWGALTVSFAGSYSLATVLTITAIFGHQAFGWGAVETGWALVGISGSITWGRLVAVPWCAKHWGLKRTLVTSLLLGVPALLAASYSFNSVSFAVGVALIGFTATGTTVLAHGVVSRHAPPTHRGLLMGVAHALWAAALFLGAMINGPLLEFVARGAPYQLAAIVLIAAVPIALWKLEPKPAAAGT